MSEEATPAQEAPATEIAPAQVSDMGKAVAAMMETENINAEVSDVEIAGIESDIDVPSSSFWDNTSEGSEETEPQLDAEAPDTAEPDVSAEQTIKFKANGEEVEISMADAIKQLSMAEGSRQAFSKLDKANKRVEELEQSLPDLQRKAEMLDKLDSVKHDWKQIIKIATGQDADAFMADAMRKQGIIDGGDDAQIASLKREERMAELERELYMQQERQKNVETRETERLAVAQKAELKGLLDAEFHKHQIETGNDIDSNAANDMLYNEGKRRFGQYVKKYQDHAQIKQLIPRMAAKAFDEVAGEMKRLSAGTVQSQLDKAISDKKAKAAELAGIASTRRATDPDPDKYKGMSVAQIADKLRGLTGKNRFSKY